MDIIYVSYNSQKWIKGCFESVLKSDYDLKKVSVFVVDNKSTDGTLEELKKMQSKCEEYLREFRIIESPKNLGFGGANNLGFSKGKDEIACFFNIDTELYPDTLNNLEEEMSNFSFLRIHQSFLVNMKHIKCVTCYKAILSNHQEIAIPKVRYRDVKNTFVAFKGEM